LQDLNKEKTHNLLLFTEFQNKEAPEINPELFFISIPRIV